MGSRQRELPRRLRHDGAARPRIHRRRQRNDSEPVAVVNEAFVKRFFKSDEDPLERHFGLDEPQNVGTFRIVGVVRDAKFAGWGLSRPARPMFYVPLAQNVDYAASSVMARVERQSHFIGGLMLVTNDTPGTLEPLLTKAIAEIDPNLTIVDVSTMKQQVSSRSIRSAPSRASPGCSASSRWCWRRSACTASRPTRSRSERTRSGSGWRSARIARA